MITAAEMKAAVGAAAAAIIEPGMTVGLGSGTTAHAFVRALGERVRAGLEVHGVASSLATSNLASEYGIKLGDLNAPLDIAVDGADAVDVTTFAAIKGLGGALTRERIVAASAARFVVIVDTSKVFPSFDSALDTTLVPVAVVPFGWRTTSDRLSSFGTPLLRTTDQNEPYLTDDGNYIVDLQVTCRSSVYELAAHLKSLTGVVDHGIFADLATDVFVGDEDGVSTLPRAIA